MKKTILWLVLVTALEAKVVGAETIVLVCENWHKRLGQLEDRTFTIDLEARTCNGQPCAISDSDSLGSKKEVAWSSE